MRRYVKIELPEFELDAVAFPKDAIDLLGRKIYRVIISDYGLGPGEMNGIDFLKIVRKKFPYIPLVLYTANPVSSFKKMVERPFACFQKGFDESKMFQYIREMTANN